MTVPFCLVHSSGQGMKRIEKRGGRFEPLDKLLGAGRLGVRYLIGSLEHSSVSCSRTAPVGGGGGR